MRIAQRIDDRRVRFPDVLPAEQRQRAVVDAVGLHRVDDLVVLHAVVHARVEVVDAVGRRRVDDAGAILGRGVVGEIHRRDAVIARMRLRQRMVEADAVEVPAMGGRDNASGEPVARETLLDQRLGE